MCEMVLYLLWPAFVMFAIQVRTYQKHRRHILMQIIYKSVCTDRARHQCVNEHYLELVSKCAISPSRDKAAWVCAFQSAHHIEVSCAHDREGRERNMIDTHSNCFRQVKCLGHFYRQMFPFTYYIVQDDGAMFAIF